MLLLTKVKNALQINGNPGRWSIIYARVEFREPRIATIKKFLKDFD